MDTTKLFKKKVNELESLPEKPKVFWYVSAGKDFRGPVFLTQTHINHLLNHGRDFIKPDLFVFNCLGPDVEELRQILSNNKQYVFRNDGLTRIIGRNYTELPLNDKINFNINHEYIDPLSTQYLGNNINNLAQNRPPFYFELEITGTISGQEYTEVQKILYFEAENINFFNNIILGNYFEVLYLCATREGCGFDGCIKSIIEYIYEDHNAQARPHNPFFINSGFKPKYNIVFTDYTLKLFKDNINNNNEILKVEWEYNYYISEENFRGSQSEIIFKLNYLE